MKCKWTLYYKKSFSRLYSLKPLINRCEIQFIITTKLGDIYPEIKPIFQIETNLPYKRGGGLKRIYRLNKIEGFKNAPNDEKRYNPLERIDNFKRIQEFKSNFSRSTVLNG